jgi:hypothetical protein
MCSARYSARRVQRSPVREGARGTARRLACRSRLSAQRRAALEARHCPSSSNRLPHGSRRHCRRHRAGRALKPDPRGRTLRVWEGFRVAPAGEIFLMNWQSEDFLDGCYFGSLPATAIFGRAEPSGSQRRIERAANLSIFLRPMAVADTKPTLIPGHGLYRRDHVDRVATLRSSGARHGDGEVFDAGGRRSRELRTDAAVDPSRRRSAAESPSPLSLPAHIAMRRAWDWIVQITNARLAEPVPVSCRCVM